ncbi:MAG: sigma-E processing peptidase SpoIIGA [Oscillospiraceae bacterium]
MELVTAAGESPELAGRMRLIPFSALGGTGLLPVFRPDSVRVDGEERTGLLAAISAAAAGDGFEGIL